MNAPHQKTNTSRSASGFLAGIRQWWRTHQLRHETPCALSYGEDDKAKAFWSGRGVRKFYAEESHWSRHMAEQVLAFGPERVLEFGCNVGRNLVAIHKRAPDIRLKGVDINAEAVAHGHNAHGLDLSVADENYLADQPDNSVDVVFTVSVLDHMPEPLPTLRDMTRIAGKAVLLLEPYTGSEGKVVRNFNLKAGKVVDTTPFSYSWDYPRLAGALDVNVESHPYPLSGTNLGPYYHLYTLHTGG